jgi:hypothetical protein
MAKNGWSSTFRCALWAGAALVAFTACGFLAAAPMLSEPLRIALVLAGYVSFVGLFRCALRARRTDWSELWSQPKGPARTQMRFSRRAAKPFQARHRMATRTWV